MKRYSSFKKLKENSDSNPSVNPKQAIAESSIRKFIELLKSNVVAGNTAPAEQRVETKEK